VNWRSSATRGLTASLARLRSRAPVRPVGGQERRVAMGATQAAVSAIVGALVASALVNCPAPLKEAA
jgi:hypothetical protein